MKLFLTLLFLDTHVYSGHAAIRGAIAEESKLLAAMKRVLRESSPYSGHAAVRGADDTASGADAAEKRIIEDLRVANYCGMFNAPCVTGAVCAQDPNANRLTCLCDASEGWTNGVAMDHRDIENIKKYNLFGFLSCSHVNECLDPTKHDCASADQCEDRSPGPLSSDQYACFCKTGFAPSAEGLRGPTQCHDINECNSAAPCLEGQCNNNEGSFDCTCTVDGVVSLEVNGLCPRPKEKQPRGCGDNSAIACNGPGQYCSGNKCLCAAGWFQPSGVGGQCEDINECDRLQDSICDLRGRHTDNPRSKCINIDKSTAHVITLGYKDGYTCECLPGFMKRPNTQSGTDCMAVIEEVEESPSIAPIEPTTSSPVEESPSIPPVGSQRPPPQPTPPQPTPTPTTSPTSPGFCSENGCRFPGSSHCVESQRACECKALFTLLYRQTELRVKCQPDNCRQNEAKGLISLCSGKNTQCEDLHHEDDGESAGYACVCREHFFQRDEEAQHNCDECRDEHDCPANSECVTKDFGTDDEVKMCSIVDCNEHGECAGDRVCVDATCHTCRDSSGTTEPDANDEGCDDETRICLVNQVNGIQSDSATLTGTGLAGDVCVMCINSNKYAGLDYGCSGNEPFCRLEDGRDPFFGRAGAACVKCINNQGDFSSIPDDGCSIEEKFCASIDGIIPAYNYVGRQCWSCVNNKRDGQDQGCDEAKPHCVNDYGTEPDHEQAGHKCVALIEDEYPSEDDSYPPSESEDEYPSEDDSYPPSESLQPSSVLVTTQHPVVPTSAPVTYAPVTYAPVTYAPVDP